VSEKVAPQWPRIGHRRGNLMRMFADRHWRWADNGRFAGSITSRFGDRPCVSCGLVAAADGHDPCLGELPDVKAACCGHGGAAVPYIAWEDGTVQRGEDVVWPTGILHSEMQ
jgi:hypothetical protein